MALCLDREELAWAAGLFDGEGHIARRPSTRGSRRRMLTVDVCQNDRRVLDRFQAAVGGLGRVYGPYRQPTRNPQWHFATSNFEHVQSIVAMLWFKLSPMKREQARRALFDVLESDRQYGPRRRRSPCEHGQRFSACEACRRQYQKIKMREHRARLRLVV